MKKQVKRKYVQKPLKSSIGPKLAFALAKSGKSVGEAGRKSQHAI